jgi:hypothetical protein
MFDMLNLFLLSANQLYLVQSTYNTTHIFVCTVLYNVHLTNSTVASNINKRLGILNYVSIKIRLGQSLGNRKIQSIVKHTRKLSSAKGKS